MKLIRKLKHKVRSKIIYTQRDIQKSLGNMDSKLQYSTGSAIVVYHGVDKNGNRRFNTRFVSAKQFEAHLIAYTKYFNVVSVSDIADGNIDKDRFNIALTFDDGYLNNLKIAVPILQKYKCPATFCVTSITETEHPILWTDMLDISAALSKDPVEIQGIKYAPRRRNPWGHSGYLDANGTDLKYTAKQSDQQFKEEIVKQLMIQGALEDLDDLWPYWKQLSTEEICQLSDIKEMEIASHGHYHNNLGEIEFESAKEEMKRSKVFLEKVCGQSIDIFAYPDGSYNQELITYGKQLGYKTQLVTDYLSDDNRDDPQVLDRLTINPYISTYNQLISIIEGSYIGQGISY